MTTVHHRKSERAAQQVEEDDWSLTPEQMLFMLQHHNAIESAYETEDIAFLRELADSPAYKAVFGSMGWDAAYDRYESTWWEDDDKGQA